MRAHAVRLAVSAAAVALVTGAIFGLREVAPVLSLGVLYVFAVLPVAVSYGLAYAIAVSVASMLAFNFSLPSFGTEAWLRPPAIAAAVTARSTTREPGRRSLANAVR